MEAFQPCPRDMTYFVPRHSDWAFAVRFKSNQSKIGIEPAFINSGYIKAESSADWGYLPLNSVTSPETIKSVS